MAQLVVLPAPRLLTTLPMGGQVGSTVEVTIHGENLENVTELLFSTPKITAEPVRDADGKPVAGKPVPLTYYHESGGMAAALSILLPVGSAPLEAPSLTFWAVVTLAPIAFE